MKKIERELKSNTEMASELAAVESRMERCERIRKSQAPELIDRLMAEGISLREIGRQLGLSAAYVSTVRTGRVVISRGSWGNLLAFRYKCLKEKERQHKKGLRK